MTNPGNKSNESLRDHPTIATEITCYIGNFNALEAMLHLIFSQMINDKVGMTHAFLSPWNSFAQKLGIIIEIAKLHGSNSQATIILNHEQNLKDLNTFRNLLAHSAYSVKDGNIEAISYIVSNRHPKTTAITTAAIDKKRALLRTVLDDFMRSVRKSDGTDGNVYRRTAV